MEIRFSKIVFLVLIFNQLFADSVSLIEPDSHNTQKYTNYIIAELDLARGELKAAEEGFKNFTKIDNNKAGRLGLLRTWFREGKFDLIAQQQNDFPIDNLEIHLAFVMAYLNTNRIQEAEASLDRLLKVYHSNEQIAYFYVLLLTNTNRETKALAFLDSFLKKVDTSSSRYSFFYFLKAKIYVQMNNYESALKAINKCLDLNSQFDKAWLLKALLAEQNGDIDTAFKSYHTYLDVVGNDEKIIRRLVVLLFNNNRFLDAEKELKKVANDSAEYFFDLALIQAKAKQLDSALENVNNALQKNITLLPARVLKAEVLLNKGQTSEAVDFVLGWLEQMPSDKVALGLLPALQKSGASKEKILEMLHAIVDKGVVNKNLLAALTDMYVDAKKLYDALPYYEQILKLTKDQLLKSKIYYQMGYTYFVMGDGDKVESLLKQAITFNEVFIPAYNLLAYYYVHTDKNLDYAMTLIDKALAENPKHPVFLDTKGYIVYKQGNKVEARKFFRKALFVTPEDKIIKEHLAMANR